MLETNRVDLSIPSNQKRLITTFNEFFSTEELEQIDIRFIRCPADKEAIKACHGMEYRKEIGNSHFTIECVLNVGSIPPQHHTRIGFCKDGIYETHIECNPNFMNPNFLAAIVCKSLNFSKYKSAGDPHYNRRSVIDNVAKRAAGIVPEYDDLIHYRNCITEELYENYGYESLDGRWIHKFNDSTLTFTAEYELIFKVEFESPRGYDYVYCPRSDLGMNIIMLVIDKAIVALKDQIFEEMEATVI